MTMEIAMQYLMGRALDDMSAELVDDILTRLEQGDIHQKSFRCLLDDLASTPLLGYTSQICDKLYSIVERNLDVPEEQLDERVAVDCAIRKMVFNLADDNLFRVAALLENAAKYRVNDEATFIEKLLYKVLVDRCEFRPLPRIMGIESIAKICHDTVEHFGMTVDAKTKITQVVFIDALVAFACYATEEQLLQSSFHVDVPEFMHRFCFYVMSKDIQKAIDQKIPEENLRRNVVSFITQLTETAS